MKRSSKKNSGYGLSSLLVDSDDAVSGVCWFVSGGDMVDTGQGTS